MIAEKELELIIADLEVFTAAFRKQWYSENKTYGFSVQEIRLGGLRERLLSAKYRLLAYLDGEIDKIDELHEPIRTVYGNAFSEGAEAYVGWNSWARNSSACVVSHSF